MFDEHVFLFALIKIGISYKVRKTAPASKEYIWMTFSQMMNGCCGLKP